MTTESVSQAPPDALVQGALCKPEDDAFMEALRSGIREVCAANGASFTPLLALRIEDLVLASLALRRVLDGFAVQDTELTPADHELLNKAIERRRKAVREIEDACQRAGTPLEQGLADEMAPLIAKADGVLEDALAFEQHKHAKNNGAKTEVHGQAEE